MRGKDQGRAEGEVARRGRDRAEGKKECGGNVIAGSRRTTEGARSGLPQPLHLESASPTSRKGARAKIQSCPHPKFVSQ